MTAARGNVKYRKKILDNYPGLTREDSRACLVYASAVLKAEKVYPVALSKA